MKELFLDILPLKKQNIHMYMIVHTVYMYMRIGTYDTYMYMYVAFWPMERD